MQRHVILYDGNSRLFVLIGSRGWFARVDVNGEIEIVNDRSVENENFQQGACISIFTYRKSRSCSNDGLLTFSNERVITRARNGR